MSDGFMDNISPFDRKLSGMHGEFGAGANARVRFVQTVLKPQDLKNVSLISSIPGSETWSVVDLFQRNVDMDRVTHDIIPYLENPAKIKFFNPLTLTILPMTADGRAVGRDMPVLTEAAPDDTRLELWHVHEDYYRLGTKGQFAVVEWNSVKCHLVAIDGQHRLSALQRILNSSKPNVDLSTWTVPVVIMLIEKANPVSEAASLLELVRNTFVYINTQAIRVNRAREILLNDELPSTICTQEFVQSAHRNDNVQIDQRDRSKLPLLLLDWRGETSRGRPVSSPAALKAVEEIRGWLIHYIIGEDYESRQRTELAIDDLIPPITGFSNRKALTSPEAAQIREQFTERVLPGLDYFLQHFEPYAMYIAEIRSLEEKMIEASDLSRHAFQKLRFGAHNASEDLLDGVNAAFEDVVDEITAAKESFLPPLLKLDIGMRGVMYAFGRIATLICESRLTNGDARPAWLEIAELVVPAANWLASEGWFDVEAGGGGGARAKKHYKYLYLLAFDLSGAVVNYRLEDAEGGLGSLLALLMAAYMRDVTKTMDEATVRDLWNDEVISLAKTVENGAKKLHRSLLSTTFEGTQAEFKEKVNKEAKITREKHLRKLQGHLGLI